MNQLITDYRTLIFDCDGVVLNSNQTKTEAFYRAALPYGEAAAKALADYHVANGGISRYKKFAYFLEQIIPEYAPTQSGPNLEALIEAYAAHVKKGLIACASAAGLESLRKKTPDARWLIVSGGDQAELREVFALRGMAEWFDGGIFGSPDTKDEILNRELLSGTIQFPALFLGDSKYDYQAASTAGLDFVFLSGWSEVTNWHEWTAGSGIPYVTEVKDLLMA